jgi:hypothetical protein
MPCTRVGVDAVLRRDAGEQVVGEGELGGAVARREEGPGEGVDLGAVHHELIGRHGDEAVTRRRALDFALAYDLGGVAREPVPRDE